MQSAKKYGPLATVRDRRSQSLQVTTKRRNSMAGLGIDPRLRQVGMEGQEMDSNGSAVRPQESKTRIRLQRSMSASGMHGGAQQQVTDILEEQAKDPEAEWKQMQEKTFTRWCDQHLQKADLSCENLATAFEDGTKLIVLVEALSGRSLGRYNKVTKRLPQKLENVGMVLRYLQMEEGLRLVNIGNNDIVMDHNLKLVLGLVWTLILHYQVSMLSVFPAENGQTKSKGSPKDMLLKWLREKLAPRVVRNLTTAWNDGTLIAALVDAVGPGLFPEKDEADPADNLDTATKAMNLAEEWLGVPQVLQASDMCNQKVDEKSMITYLSFFPKAVLKDGAPVASAGNQDDDDTGDGEIKCYGPALDETVVCSTPAVFSIDATEKEADREISWRFMCNVQPEVQSTPREGEPRIVDVTFQASKPGSYPLDVLYGGKPTSKEPYMITVERPKPDASKVVCSGEGLQRHVPNEPSDFTVDCSNAGGIGWLEVGMEGGNSPSSKLTVTHGGDYVFEVQYFSDTDATILVHIRWYGEEVAGSPFTVQAIQVDL